MEHSKIEEIKNYLLHASELIQRSAINHKDVELEDLIKALSHIECCRGILFDENSEGKKKND